MARREITKDQMLQRVAKFADLTPSSIPLVDAVLPQFHRQIFNVIGRGVTEDPNMKVPITAVEGFHLSIIKAAPGKGTGLHDHTTVEVFMALSGRWAVQWGDHGENELVLDTWDVISVPTNVMRNFRNVGEQEAHLLAIVGGNNPGSVEWVPEIRQAVREKGFDLDAQGKIVEVAKA
jgi:mannose-6-phosphate isomerase-like protein (cupin superfamily)